MFIGEETSCVVDWSMGGVAFDTPVTTLNIGDSIDLKIRFSVGTESLDIVTKGQIVRKGQKQTAARFHELTNDNKQTLNRVVDNLSATAFSDSQSIA